MPKKFIVNNVTGEDELWEDLVQIGSDNEYLIKQMYDVIKSFNKQIKFIFISYNFNNFYLSFFFN